MAASCGGVGDVYGIAEWRIRERNGRALALAVHRLSRRGAVCLRRRWLYSFYVFFCHLGLLGPVGCLGLSISAERAGERFELGKIRRRLPPRRVRQGTILLTEVVTMRDAAPAGSASLGTSALPGPPSAGSSRDRAGGSDPPGWRFESAPARCHFTGNLPWLRAFWAPENVRPLKHNGQYGEQAEHGAAGAGHRLSGRGQLDPRDRPPHGRGQEHRHQAAARPGHRVLGLPGRRAAEPDLPAGAGGRDLVVRRLQEGQRQARAQRRAGSTIHILPADYGDAWTF